jgi:hypothetical protein
VVHAAGAPGKELLVVQPWPAAQIQHSRVLHRTEHRLSLPSGRTDIPPAGSRLVLVDPARSVALVLKITCVLDLLGATPQSPERSAPVA